MKPEEIRNKWDITGPDEFPEMTCEILIEIAATLAEIRQELSGKREAEREIPYPVVIDELADVLLASVTMPDGEIHEFLSTTMKTHPEATLGGEAWCSMEDGGRIGLNRISRSIDAELWKRENEPPS